MTKRVLIVGNNGHDISTEAVAKKLRLAGFNVFILNSLGLSEDQFINFSVEKGMLVRDRNVEQEYIFNSFLSVWLRRWNTPRIIKKYNSNSSDGLFAEENWQQMFRATSLISEVAWLNDPVRQQVGANKIYQLKIAKEVGFNVPQTLITSDPFEAKEFINSYHKVVCKSFANHFKAKSTATILLKENHLKKIDLIRVCPSIFQQFIPVYRDIRVIIVGDEIFCAEINTNDSQDKVDWRLDANTPWLKHDLPSNVERKCFSILYCLGLDYGAIDLRLTPDGDYYFFEVNPAGQFMFIEVWTRMNISGSIANLLVSKIWHNKALERDSKMRG